MSTHIHRRFWLSLAWILVLLVMWLSLTTNPHPLDIQYNDKVGHLLAYATLAFWFGQLHPRRLVVVLACLAMGGSMELLQGLTDYRDMSLADMFANGCGVALGWLLARLVPDFFERLEAFLP
jgi:VanZ family protein